MVSRPDRENKKIIRKVCVTIRFLEDAGLYKVGRGLDSIRTVEKLINLT